MNIYMTGASGTGKTSLAQELCLRLGMYEAPSVARTSPYEMGTQSCQDYIMHCVDYQCRTVTQSVVTRTPLDVYAYSYVWKLDCEKPWMVANRFVNERPIMLYLPKYWEPEDDGFRPTTGQDEVDAAIYKMLSETNVLFNPMDLDYYTVLNESIEQRADSVIKWLNERGLMH